MATDGDGSTDDGPGIDGRRVSEDATGADGSDRGVDGRQIADEASDGRAGGPDEPPGQSGEAPGQAEEPPGQAEEPPGQVGKQAPGPSKPETSSPATTRGRAGD